MAHIIDGKQLALKLTEDVTKENAEYCKRHAPPCLAVIASGEDPASQVYIKMTKRAVD